jgi:hypothetical protein
MFVNAKMIPVETVPGIRRGGMKESSVEWVNSRMIYLTHCKNFCKCYNVPIPSITVKKERKKLWKPERSGTIFQALKKKKTVNSKPYTH